jgi:uncharacterized membrane protein YphA (DoxX/SURF4 family)
MKTKILFGLCLLFGLMFINAGLNKFFNYMPMPTDLPEKMQRAWQAFNEIGWLMPLVGAAEVLGGLLLIWPRTRALGALVLFPVLVGIVLTNLVAAPSGLSLVAVLVVIYLWVLYEERAKYLPLLK